MKKIICLLLFMGLGAHAQLSKIGSSFGSRMSSAQYESMIQQLISTYPYAAIPFYKEYMVLKPQGWSSDFERSFDQLIEKVGTQNFENLPEKMINRFQTPSVRYILGKKYFNQGDFPKALSFFNQIPESSYLWSLSEHAKGVIYSLNKNYDLANNSFNNCLKKKSNFGEAADLCQAGKARNLYAERKLDLAEKAYGKISKTSPVWPSILFEEAWNSYYQGKYNKTLGKLVSYKAPVFNFVFNPEVETLKAMSFLKLCLYADAQKVLDDFYKDYGSSAKQLESFIRANRKKLNTFYDLMIKFETSRSTQSVLLGKILNAIRKEPAYKEIKSGLLNSLREKKKLLGEQGRLKNRLSLNLNEVLDFQRSLLGKYVAIRMIEYKNSIMQALQDMSYIKLEVLDRLKQRIYRNEKDEGKRGDIKYLSRKPSQYFWNFNGEFWADELGDYVFALANKCGKNE